MGSTVPHGVAFLIRFIYGVMQILTKVAFTQGTSTSVLVFYRHIVATAVLLPVTLVVERKTAPPLSFKVSLKLFVHALYGMSASMNISSIGLNYASATSASAVQNLVPVLTFFLAVLLGVESLKLKMHHGVVKVSGIVFCAVGVTVLALYQGPDLKSFINHHLFPHTNSAGTHSLRNWILGIFLQSFATLMWALWAVLQGPLLEEYPSKLLNTTLQIVFATVQSFFMALVLERDFSRWKLGFDVGLVAIIYCHNKWSADGCWPVYRSLGEEDRTGSYQQSRRSWRRNCAVGFGGTRNSSCSSRISRRERQDRLDELIETVCSILF
uniref:WAT1-related protein n=1 Tax=Oryza brachyantha TaxID=4533 RepID=J3L0W6_ORYBR